LVTSVSVAKTHSGVIGLHQLGMFARSVGTPSLGLFGRIERSDLVNGKRLKGAGLVQGVYTRKEMMERAEDFSFAMFLAILTIAAILLW